MHISSLLLTLTGSLAAALLLGFATQRIRLSPIVGYLLAGVLVGPYTPGFVADRAMATEFAELGVILLMFGVGLHFRLEDLLAVWRIAITGALCQSAVATGLGVLAGLAYGWSGVGSLIFGLALSVASTVMLTRVLADNQALQTPIGRVSVGWLVVEDVFTVVVLVLLPAVFSAPGETVSIPVVLLTTSAELFLLVALAVVVGRRVIPRILSGVAHTQSRELFTLTVLVIALGIAVGSALAFGVSMALGAFLAGMIVGQSEFSFRAASDALPMRDAFAVLFFVSVGMLFDPKALLQAPGLLAATLAIVLLGKPLVAFLITAVLGYGSKTALGVALALAQIGEFSLILATVGDQLHLFPAGATNLIVATAIASLTLNPLLFGSLTRLEAQFRRRPTLWRLFNRQEMPDAVPSDSAFPLVNHTVLVGYGPIGQTLARLLREGGIPAVIVDINLAATRRATAAGHAVVYGDGATTEILESTHLRTAVALVIAGPTVPQATEIIRLARTMNPRINVLTRSHYLREAALMKSAGADQVFSGEGEVALAMAEHVMLELGATAEQIDRERQRVRQEVFGISGRA